MPNDAVAIGSLQRGLGIDLPQPCHGARKFRQCFDDIARLQGRHGCVGDKSRRHDLHIFGLRCGRRTLRFEEPHPGLFPFTAFGGTDGCLAQRKSALDTVTASYHVGNPAEDFERLRMIVTAQPMLPSKVSGYKSHGDLNTALARDIMNTSQQPTLQERLAVASNLMSFQMQPFVTPISGALADRTAILVGTGGYVEWRRKRLLLTNEHVAREVRNHSLARKCFDSPDYLHINNPYQVAVAPEDLAFSPVDDRWNTVTHSAMAFPD